MQIIRPWASQGDYFEIAAPDAEDWAALLDRLRAVPVTTEDAQRYIAKRYGTVTPE